MEFNKKDEEKTKNLHATLKILNEKLKTNPGDYKSRIHRAHIRHVLGNKVLALYDYNWIKYRINKIAKDKKIKPSGEHLARVYDVQASIYASLEMDNYAAHYRYKATKADPENNRLKYNLASYLYTIKSYRLSLHYLNEVLEKWKGHAFSHRLLAAIYTDLEDYEKAKYHIDHAFPKEENLIKFGYGKLEQDIRTIRGLISHKLGNSESGINDLKDAIDKNKDNSFAHRNLGAVYYDLGEYKLACEYLQKAKELGYEKMHDRYDLQEYLDFSCQNTAKTEIKEKAVKTLKLAAKPFVYPNPSKDFIQIKNLPFKTYTFEIYDYTAKLITNGAPNNNSINISNLQTGVYILKVYSGRIVETFRVVKE